MPRLRVYCSDQTHSSIDKAVILLGLGHESLRKIPSDAEFRMRPDALAAAVAEDRAAGWLPIAVVATVGTTSSTSVDPVPAIAEICRRESMWLHVDAAYAGVAAMVPGYEWILRGAERADSLVVNPHKWLFTPFDLSAFYCRRMDVVRAAFSLTPEYLKTVEAAPVRNLMDTGVQLGRRFRALKLWMVLRHFGAEGLRARLAEHMRLAQRVRRLGRRQRSASNASRRPLQRRLLPRDRAGPRPGGARCVERSDCSSGQRDAGRSSSRTPSSTAATRCGSRSATSTPPRRTSRARGNSSSSIAAELR